MPSSSDKSQHRTLRNFSPVYDGNFSKIFRIPEQLFFLFSCANGVDYLKHFYKADCKWQPFHFNVVFNLFLLSIVLIKYISLCSSQALSESRVVHSWISTAYKIYIFAIFCPILLVFAAKRKRKSIFCQSAVD